MADEREAPDRHAQVARGLKASAELQETAAAFEAVEAALIADFRRCPVGADARILELHKALQNLHAVQTALKAVVINGQHAQAALAAVDLVEAEDDA